MLDELLQSGNFITLAINNKFSILLVGLELAFKASEYEV
jgi:hypothetical protein